MSPASVRFRSSVLALIPLLSVPALAVAQGSAGEKKAEGPTVLFADVVYTAAGEPLRGGNVTLANGKIAAVAPGGTAGDRLKVGAITPGMVDLSARVAGTYSVEQSREIQPGLRVADTLDPFAVHWDRFARTGVTTVLVGPPDWNVIGGLSIALKTAGEPSIAARTLREDAALRGSMGTQPSRGNHPAFGRPTDFFSRRPTTRMGVEWEWRKAFYDTLAAEKDSSRAFPGSDVLLRVLNGELPLFVQAWATQDIRTAVFLKEEMAQQGKPDLRLVIDAGAEAWREPDLLVRTGTPVVLPPFPHEGRTTDGAFMAWKVASLLRERGVDVALSSHDARPDDARLSMQAAYARRGGLTRDEALAAVTIAPARMLGIDDRVGSIEVGKDADLVLWSGEPFDLTSRVIGVVVDGVWVVDPREDGRTSQ